jgi:hypothetical protein
MSSALFVNVFRFILLLTVQIVVFNNISLFGFLSPFPYILYIILFPVNGNKYALLVSSFLLGLIMDIFLNSGGVHTAACLILAYYRQYIFKFSFGLSYEYQTVKLNDSLTPERFSFILLSVSIHHFVLFLLDSLYVLLFWNLVVRTVLSIFFTIILCIIIIYLIKPNNRR